MEIDKDRIQKIIDKLIKNGAMAAINNDAITELKELIESKWEPKKYNKSWTILSYGYITSSTVSAEEDRLYGNEFPTKEAAETARDMNKRNQLILQYKTEKGYGDGRWSIKYDLDGNDWYCGTHNPSNPELTFETQEQAEETLKAAVTHE